MSNLILESHYNPIISAGDLVLEDINYDYGKSNLELIEDVERGERIYMFKGTFARANYANLNKRVYPTSVLGEAYKDVKRSMEEDGSMLVGEMEHAQNAKVAMERIACYFPELTFNESTGELNGIAKPSSTPMGEILKGLMKDGIRVGFSTRASGQVKPYRGPLGEGLVEVQPGLKLVSIDAVYNPSARCFPNVFVESEQESKYHFMSGVSNFKSIWDGSFLNK